MDIFIGSENIAEPSLIMDLLISTKALQSQFRLNFTIAWTLYSNIDVLIGNIDQQRIAIVPMLNLN